MRSLATERPRDRAWAPPLGDHETAQRLFRETLALKAKTLPADDPDVLRTLVSQAEDLHAMGRTEEALEITTRACRSFAVAYGPGSDVEALCLNNRGEYLLDLGRARDALSVFDSSLSRWEADLGADHRYLAFPLTGLGRAQLALGRPREASSFLERALRIREANETDPSLKAETQFALAQVLWSTGETARAAPSCGREGGLSDDADARARDSRGRELDFQA